MVRVMIVVQVKAALTVPIIMVFYDSDLQDDDDLFAFWIHGSLACASRRLACVETGSGLMLTVCVSGLHLFPVYSACRARETILLEIDSFRNVIVQGVCHERWYVRCVSMTVLACVTPYCHDRSLISAANAKLLLCTYTAP